LTDAQADQLFDPTNGIGLSILRIGMGTNGDQNEYQHVGRYWEGESSGVTTFIGSLWSPPANCKSNNNVTTAELAHELLRLVGNYDSCFPARVSRTPASIFTPCRRRTSLSCVVWLEQAV